MTNTEAITKLTNIMHDDIYSWSPAILTAFNMAVDALKGAEAQSTQTNTSNALNALDCISRQAAIEVIDAVFPVDPMKSEYAQGIACGAALAKAYVEQLPSAQLEKRWIPCEEQLPEKEVLCCDVRGEMIIGYPYKDIESNTGFSAVLDDVYLIDCIAWMPLPEPWKGDSGE